MKHFFYFLLGSPLFSAFVWATSTANIGKVTYTFNPDDIFPSPKKVSSAKGVDNIIDYITGTIPLLTTLMAIGATLMVIIGGFYMVMGGASSEQTEKGKGIIKDAILGILIGLLAYVIIVTLGNILDI